MILFHLGAAVVDFAWTNPGEPAAKALEDAHATPCRRQQAVSSSGPWDVLQPAPHTRAAATPSASSSSEPRPSGPGLRRDHTRELRELRAVYNDQHRKRAGPRLPELLAIIEQGDPLKLASFLEVVRGSIGKARPQQGCAWCNTLITAKASDSGPLIPIQGFAKECEICQAWHCSSCCSSFIALNGERPNQAPTRGSRRRSSSRPVGITCCDPCRRAFEIQHLWKKEAPPDGLPEPARRLFEMHKDIAGGLTSYGAALAQLEGLLLTLIREIETSPSSGDAEDLRVECRQALAASQHSLAAAKHRVETALRQIEELRLQAPTKSIRVKEALLKHGKAGLRDLERRSLAAQMRMEAHGLEAAPPASLD